MAEKSGVPLICDEVPGPSNGYLVTRQPMTAADVERIKREWQEETAARHAAYIGPPGPKGFTFVPLPLPGERRQWPDAEFCAA